MIPAQVVVAGIAGGTFVFLTRPRIGEIPLSRSVTSAVGAILVVVLGFLSPSEAIESLDSTTLLLLFGMLCHVEALRRSGCYEWAAAVLVERTTTVRQLTLGALALSALLSAVLLNDATVLLLTPVLITATQQADVESILPLLSVIVGANIGSLATPLGNPQNAFILAQSGIPTATFIVTLAPVALVSLCFTALVLAVFANTSTVTTSPERPTVDGQWAFSSIVFVLSTVVILTLFPTGQPGIIAASMGITHVVWLQVFRRVPGTQIVQSIDWGILVMFAGIFVLVGALEHVGTTQALTAITRQLSLPLTVFVLSNMVSNVPAVALLAPTVHSTADWILLAAVSTLAGTATPIGSAATLIVLDQAQREGISIPLWRLLRVGCPIAVISSVVAVGMLSVG